ncbi:ATP-binding protein [Leptospirillum ferrooxidans]|uniref:histidine kinase n=1 Tax=Leptospirillum ferrooxidans (strain C2-3) TaxID=1162668 RepID=I0IRM8_LEPFC|nr:ATP-binding protein [Leptospirillum ferrooxidans]BAM07927.1 putative periplasmic sensor signal transduction histidine kinase [Leptospirillum ferrooxidans C2-3]
MKIHDLFPIITICLTIATMIVAYIAPRRKSASAFLLLAPLSALLPVLASFFIFIPQTLLSIDHNFQLWLAGETLSCLGLILFSLGFSRQDPWKEIRGQKFLLAFIISGILLATYEILENPALIKILLLPGPSVLLINSPEMTIFAFFIMGMIILSLFQLSRTYISAAGVERWNIKYPMIGVFLWTLSVFLVHTNQVLSGGFERSFLYLEDLGLFSMDFLFLYSLLIQRVKDVSLQVSRNAINRSLLLLLGGGGLIFLGGLSSTLKEFGPVWSRLSSSLMVFLGVAALLVLFSSERLRRELEYFLGIHFYSSRYDYRATWMTLTKVLSESKDLREMIPTLMERTREISFAESLVYCHIGEGIPQTISVRQSLGWDHPTPLNNDILAPSLLSVLLSGSPIHQKDSFTPEQNELLSGLFNSLSANWILPLVFRNKILGLLGLNIKNTGSKGLSEDRLFLQALSVQWVSLLVSATLSREMAWTWESDLLSGLRAFTFHDLKNAGIALKLILHNARDNIMFADFQEELLQNLQSISHQIEQSVEQFLYPFRQEYTRQTSFDANNLIKNTLKGIASEKYPELETKLNFQEIPLVSGNARALETTIRNLLINAREAMQGKGIIKIATRSLDGETVLITVSDNGPGMSQEFMDNNLFRPFQTTKKKGSGLGLFSSKLLIEQSGGQIQVNSKEGVGTEFMITLPTGSPEVDNGDQESPILKEHNNNLSI